MSGQAVYYQKISRYLEEIEHELAGCAHAATCMVQTPCFSHMALAAPPHNMQAHTQAIRNAAVHEPLQLESAACI